MARKPSQSPMRASDLGEPEAEELRAAEQPDVEAGLVARAHGRAPVR